MSTTQLKINWKKLGEDAKIPFIFWNTIYESPELVWIEIQKDGNGLYICFLKIDKKDDVLNIAGNPSPWETVLDVCRYIVVQQAYDRGIYLYVEAARRGKLNKANMKKFEDSFKEPLDTGSYSLGKLLGRK